MTVHPSRPSDLIELHAEGLFCPPGGFYIDPWRPVQTALITHGHGDHAKTGMQRYHCSSGTLPILQWRLGEQDYVAHPYGEPFEINGVHLSFHPAGHVLGSAQIRVEHRGEVWVVSGDYKRQPDPTCAPFEVVPCDTFITEATFGLPIYRWPSAASVAQDIVSWRDQCAERGEAAILYCYALGKAQRVMAELMNWTDQPVWLHGAVAAGVQVYRNAGLPLIASHPVGDEAKGADFAGRLIIAPPSAAGSAWLRRFRHAQQGFASGWMRLRGNRRRRNVDRGFVVSDHADWPDLLRTIRQTGAQRVIATHGDTRALVQTLQESGVAAETLATPFGEED